MPSREPPAPKLRRRRRENVPGGRRHSHRVLVTVEEEAVLARLAAEQHVTVPRLLVEAAMSRAGETPSARRETLVKLFAFRRQLTGIATNINQLARAANTDGVLAVGTAAAIVRVGEACDRIDELIDEQAAP